MQDSKRPKVSIGLPVFNGQRYLDAAIDSILSQTWSDFELIVADNCSTDESLAVARRRQAGDPRIRVIESDRNLGAAPNFNRAFAAATGELFKWAACDDLIEPTFLETCVERLQADPAAVLAYPDALDIDEAGREIGLIYDSGVGMRTDSPDPVVRFRDLVLHNHSCISVFGLIRRESLARTGLIGPYAGSDRALLVELALQGPFVRIAEPLIRHREHAERSTRSIPQTKNRATWFDTSLARSRTFPHWSLLRKYGAAVARAELSQRQRAQCAAHLLRWVRWGGWKSLLDDLR